MVKSRICIPRISQRKGRLSRRLQFCAFLRRGPVTNDCFQVGRSMTKEQHDFINQLAERYGAHMAQLSIRRIGDRDIALDLVQETFLIACCKADTVCTHVKPAAWLYQTLSNLTKQESEKFKREIHWDDFERISGSEDLDPSMELYIPDSLSDSDRELLLLRFRDELSHREIAQRRGISEPACRKQLSRAVQRCREALKKEMA